MDELELISRLREEVLPGSADRAEHAFLASIQGTGPRSARRRGRSMSAGIVRARHGTPRLAGMPAIRRRTTPIIIASTMAAGLAAAGLTLLPGNTSPPSNTATASPAAARLLARIAAAAAAQPNPLVRDGQFVYLKTWGAGSACTAGHPANSRTITVRGGVPGNCIPGKPDEVQFWYPVSSLCATGSFLKDGTMTRFSFKAASIDPAHFPCHGTMNYPTYRFLQALPTDPHALLKLIQHTDGDPGSYWAFSTIGTLLYNAPPPPVTAALYRAAALIPGVTVVPDATDATGRPGVAVAFTSQGMRTEWIFSKKTLQYLGSREISTANGTLISQQAIQQHAIVDYAGQIPG